MKNITIKHYNNKVVLYNENAGILYTHFTNPEGITINDYIYFRKYIRRKLYKDTGIKYNIRFCKVTKGRKFIGIRFELSPGHITDIIRENERLKVKIMRYEQIIAQLKAID